MSKIADYFLLIALKSNHQEKKLFKNISAIQSPFLIQQVFIKHLLCVR